MELMLAYSQRTGFSFPGGSVFAESLRGTVRHERKLSKRLVVEPITRKTFPPRYVAANFQGDVKRSRSYRTV